MKVIIQLSCDRRIVCYAEGGCEAERYAAGIGWCVDTDTEAISDAKLEDILRDARELLKNVRT